MADDPQSTSAPSTWKAAWAADLARVASRDRWGLALMTVGWIHLTCFLGCQAMFCAGDLTSWHYVAAWGLELGLALGVLRLLNGPGWHRSTPMAGLLVRVWGTFLILSLNLASMNALTGLDHDWFKPVWATLSTFGFATTAYLLSPWFFVPAVQMYFTGLLMALNPRWNYAIYGASWCLTLQGLGLILEHRRAASNPPPTAPPRPHVDPAWAPST